MGTIVAVRKNGEACIAADALNLVEDIIQPSLNVSSGCIIKIGECIVGLYSTYAYQQAFEEVLAGIVSKSALQLESSLQIKKFFCHVHDLLRANHQLIPAAVQGQPFESMPMNALVLNRTGIFKVDSNRSVYEFKHYWAIGSAFAFALGGLHVGYDHLESASQLARASLEACGEFEGCKGKQIFLQSMRISDLHVAKPSTLAIGRGRARVTPLRKKNPKSRKGPVEV